MHAYPGEHAVSNMQQCVCLLLRLFRHASHLLACICTEELKRQADKAAARAAKQQRKAAAAAALSSLSAQGFRQPFTRADADAAAASAATPAASSSGGSAAAAAAPSLPVGLLFPGQGSQAVGMISEETARLPAVAAMLREARQVLG